MIIRPCRRLGEDCRPISSSTTTNDFISRSPIASPPRCISHQPPLDLLKNCPFLVLTLGSIIIDPYRISYLNDTAHSKYWLRAMAWGIFMTKSHLERIYPITMQTIREIPGIIVHYIDEERWFIQVGENGLAVDKTHYATLKDLLTPILPESITRDPDAIWEYLNHMLDLHIAQSRKLTLQKHTGISHRKTKRRIVPIVIGIISSYDYSELENLLFILEGDIPEKDKIIIANTIMKWIEKAVQNEQGQKYSLRYAGPLEWSLLFSQDQSLKSILEAAHVSTTSDRFTGVRIPIEFGMEGEYSLRSIVSSINAATYKVHISLVCCLFGEYVEGESLALLEQTENDR